MTARIDPQEHTAAPHGSVVLRNSCWCCGETMEKVVPRKSRGHQHFTWRCHPCDVEWTGPGALAS